MTLEIKTTLRLWKKCDSGCHPLTGDSGGNGITYI